MKISTLVKNLSIKMFSLFPLQNKVVLENFNGRGMGDDPKYIALALLERSHGKIKLIWLCNDTKASYPKGVTPVKYKSLRSLYELSTAKVWVYNTKGGFKIPKRRGQYYIQTWHATMGLKRVEKDGNLSPRYQQYLEKDAAMTDLMYANNDFYVKLYQERFWYNGPVLKVSVPRMSPLLNEKKRLCLNDKVRTFYGLKRSEKIVLYAPTFRNTDDLSIYQFDYDKLVKAADRRFGGKHVLLLRLHPKIVEKKGIFLNSKAVIQASDYPDMQELLAATDVLISDYSSSVFDFAATEKPVLLYAPDLDEYLNNDRGLYFQPSEWPFPIAKSVDELCDLIVSFDVQEYKGRFLAFYEKIGYSDDGNGDDMIAKIVLKKMGLSEK